MKRGTMFRYAIAIFVMILLFQVSYIFEHGSQERLMIQAGGLTAVLVTVTMTYLQQKGWFDQ